MKIAIIGSQGIPAQYGGFETVAENLVDKKLSDVIQYTVFCSSKDLPEKRESYKNAKLKYIPFRANGAQSIIYDIVSLIKSIHGYDVVLLLGVSGCIFLPIFRFFSKSKIIVNIDGLEHRRGKWNWFAKQFLKFSEKIAIIFAHKIIVDNKGIMDYVMKTYKKTSVFIAYGGDHAYREITKDFEKQILSFYGVRGEYSLAISRIEPENNCELILKACAEANYPLLYVGNWDFSIYSRSLKSYYSSNPNIHIINSIYDLDVLHVLRKNCSFYIHGHSAGGTNPSLVEAMFFNVPIIAFDCIYNKETTEYKAKYFRSKEDIIQLLSTNSSAL
ncbi:MAG: glycosyltransferase family 1 protein, partial [Ignavibacteria bacterium]|nr:glycosyltransferase family 1 protein [Ignavibacteria bacterium]